MANENKKNPIQSLDTIEEALSRGVTTPKELQGMLTELKAHLDTPGYLEMAQETEVKIIRDRLTRLNIKKTKETKGSVKIVKDILSKLPEEVIQLDSDDFEIEEEFDEDLFKQFESQLNKSEEGRLLLELIMGNTKQLKKRGYTINQEQLATLAKVIIRTEKGKFEAFAKNKREAIVMLMELEFSPKEMEKGGVTIEALKEKLEIYKGEATREIEDPQNETEKNEKNESNDLFVEIITDSLLSSIFIESNSEDELKEKIEALGFRIKSNNQLKRIIQEVIKEVFKKTVELERIFDREILEKVVKNEESLKKFKIALEQALPKKQDISPEPKPDKKSATSPPAPSSKTQKMNPELGPQPDQKELSQEAKEKILEGKVFDIAPEEYKEWKNVFRLLHYGRFPDDNEKRKRWLAERKEVFGTETAEEFETIRSNLRRIEQWRKIIDAKNAPQAIMEAFTKEEIDNENLGKKLKQKIDEVLALIKVEREKIVKKSVPTVNTAVAKPLPPTLQTLAPPTTPTIPAPHVSIGPVAPAIPSAPQAPPPIIAPTPIPIAKKAPRVIVNEMLESHVKKNAEHANLLKTANEFLKSDTKGSKSLDEIKKKIQELFKGLETMVNQGMEIPEPVIKNFFENGLRPDQKLLERATKNLKETENLSEEEKRNFYRLLGLGKLTPKFDKLIGILDVNPAEVEDEQNRRYLQDIQEEILEELDEIYHNYPIFELKTLRLKHQQEKTNEILKKLDNLDEFIAFFEAQIQSNLRKENLKEKTETVEKSQGASDANQSASANEEEVEKKPDAKEKKEEEKQKTKEEKERKRKEKKEEKKLLELAKKEEAGKKGKEANKKDKKIIEFLESLSIEKKLIRKDDPIYMAIKELLGKHDDLDKIKAFLKNPDSLKRQLSEEALTALENEMKNKGVDNHENLTQKLNQELKEIKEFFVLLNNRSLSAEEKTKAPEKVKRKMEIESLLESTALLSRLKKGTLDYESPREVLALIMFYLSQKDENLSMKELTLEIEQLIDKQKDKLHTGIWSKIQGFGFFLKPTLKSTLEAIAKDAEFNKLGENPEKKLAELNRLFGTDYTKVKEWIDSLPGGIEKQAHTTIPRLIAYLEMAVRDGKASYLFKVNDALELIKHLKEAQHKQVRVEVEKEFQEYIKKNPNEEPPNKMLMYINRLNESNRYIQDINKKIIQKNLAKTMAIRIAGAGLAIAGTVLNPFAWYTAIPGLAALPTFIASFTKKVPKEHQELVRQSAIRAFMGNALVLGGLASTAAIGTIAIPLTIAGGLAGTFAPEIWKNKWKIGERGLKRGLKGGEWAWKNAIKPSLPYVAAGSLKALKVGAFLAFAPLTVPYWITTKLLQK